MKTIVLAAAAAMTLAGPVLAADSHVNFAINHFAQDHETGDGPRARVLTGSKVTVSTKNTPSGHAAFALEHFAQDRETGDGPRVRHQGQQRLDLDEGQQARSLRRREAPQRRARRQLSPRPKGPSPTHDRALRAPASAGAFPLFMRAQVGG